MREHWSHSDVFAERYQGIDSTLYAQRPIAFLIATNRGFNLEVFCKSVLNSLQGSQLLERKGKDNLLHLYLACDENEATPIPHWIQDILKITLLPFREQEKNNIGAARKRQVELAGLACIHLENPILVVLDDDLTFEALTVVDGRPVKGYPFSYIHEVYLFAQNHPCDVALGGVTGAPPLPATSSMRTFLQDFLGIQSTSKQTEERWKETDYYYDLSETRTCWDTWPALSPSNRPPSVQHALNQMFHSGPENRPLVYIPSEQKPKPRIVRGGNTVVFNPTFMLAIDHPNLPRRGDSIWSILAKEQGATILEFPFPLYHNRTPEASMPTSTGSLPLEKASITQIRRIPFIKALNSRMRHDLLGASMQRAMLDDGEVYPFYVGRSGHQLRLIEECLELLYCAKQFIDQGSETHGFWALNTKDRASFVAIATMILNTVKTYLNKKIIIAGETAEKATLLIKAMRYDAQKAMEGKR